LPGNSSACVAKRSKIDSILMSDPPTLKRT
jgi:hypothetical protein